MSTRVASGRFRRNGCVFERALGRMARRRRVQATKRVAKVAMKKERV
jgi:hypothetical protein